MNVVKKTLISVLVVAALLVAGAYLLPASWSVSRSIAIHAPPAAIHPLVNNFKRWQEWEPWNIETDPSLKYEYNDTAEGVGAVVSWNGEKSGSGSMTMTQSDANTGVVFSIKIAGESEASEGRLQYEVISNGTKVTWTMSGQLGNNPISRYFGLLMDSMMGTDFEKGLAKLKKIVENVG